MKCANCGIHHNDNWNQRTIGYYQQNTEWNYETSRCPECGKLSIKIWSNNNPEAKRLVQPFSAARGPVPNEVPVEIANDYTEACNVLAISTKASAALSRRCLQSILLVFGYTQKSLAQQIDAVLAEKDAAKSLPVALVETIDAIRNFGNFSAHPIDDKSTLQIIDVEPEEAEWCLQILEELFDHYYVRPAVAAAKKAALAAKLGAAGKPAPK